MILVRLLGSGGTPMEITQIMPKQGTSPETSAKPPESGFGAILSGAQGPPGPEPPPTDNSTVREAATPEPNAQSTKPDLSSKKTDPTTLSADQLALLATQFSQVTNLTPTVPTTDKTPVEGIA